MKKYILIILFLLCFTDRSFAQGYWQFSNPKITGANLYCAKWLNSNTVLAAGGNGTILRSTDSGISWYQVFTEIQETFTSVNSPKDGMAALGSYSGYFVYSNDNGVNWNYTARSSSSGYYNSYYTFYNTTYWMDSLTVFTAHKNSQLLKSTNGGANFDYVFVKPNGLDFVYFYNSQTGWAYSDPSYDSSFYKTTNGGINFTSVLSKKYDNISGISFINYNTGAILATSNPFLYTTDSGENWIQNSVDSISDYYSLDFSDTGTVFLCGKSGKIAKTTNKGANWQYYNTGFNESLYSIDFKNKDTGIAVGANGCLLLTYNGGMNWHQRREGRQDDIEDVAFINNSTGFAVGDNGLIMKTVDGGKTFADLYPGFYLSEKLFGVYFKDQSTGFICGEQGKIIRTTNCGITWNQVHTDSQIWLINIGFVNSNTGFAVGSKQTVLRTTNAGDNWSVVYQNFFSEMQNLKVKFLNDTVGFVAGLNLLKTTDCGTNWDFVFPPSPTNYIYYNDIDIVDSLIYLLKYDYSNNWVNFMVSSNTGNNWTNVYFNWNCPSFYPSAISFINRTTGYMCGGGNTVIKTTNGGNNWQRLQFTAYPNFYPQYDNTILRSIVAFDTTSIVAVGQKGNILNGKSSITTGINITQVEHPKTMLLKQNYPNPFNPRTAFGFQVTGNSIVVIKVYDVMGREVETLVNERLGAGTYETSFDGSGLNSGVYFYRMVTDGYSETKRMVLLK